MQAVLDGAALRLRLLQPVARLHHLCGAGFLHPDDRRAVRFARQAAGRAAALQGAGLPGAAGALHRDGGVDLYRIIAIQAPVHMAGPGARPAGNPGISFLVAAVRYSRAQA